MGGAGDPTQGPENARQPPYLLSYTPQLISLGKKLNFLLVLKCREACRPVITLLCITYQEWGMGSVLKKIFCSFQRIISWEEITPVKFSTSNRGNLGKKRSPLHLPKNTRKREGVDLDDPRNQFPLQCPKGTSACPPASHCQWRPRRSG